MGDHAMYHLMLILIFQQKINNLEFEIDLTSIPQGIYFLNLLSNGSFKTKQIIKF